MRMAVTAIWYRDICTKTLTESKTVVYEMKEYLYESTLIYLYDYIHINMFTYVYAVGHCIHMYTNTE
jgi:hypothetical protein